ncbi:MAG: DMT family transporter [Gammaproteobacteria bacterium]|nr:DMT family transporter [Gammaproteobacteria bacterium]
MPIVFGYLAMLAIWSTVPLAVKWSTEGPGYLYASTARFAVAAAFLVVLVLVLRVRVPRDPRALQAYAISGLNFYCFLAGYWGVSFVPSGWMGVMWGLAPFITTVCAALWLGERSFSLLRLAGLLTGCAGLAVIFATAIDVGPAQALGVALVLVTVTVNSAAAVWLKRIGTHVPPITLAAAGALLALPAYALTWLLVDPALPVAVPLRAALSIVYLGVIGTGVVFVLLYYVLRHLEPVRISLVGMVSPVLALLLGNLVNAEPVSVRIWFGTALIVLALVLHEYLPRRSAQRVAGLNTQVH